MDEIKITDPEEEIKIEAASDEKEADKSVPKKFIFLVVGIVIVFIALLSYSAFSNYLSPTGNIVTVNDLFLKNLQGELPEDQGYTYNGFSFILFDGLWYSEVQYGNQIFQIPLHFGPKDLEEVLIEGALSDKFDQEKVYLTFNPLTSDDFLGTAMSEVAQNLAMAIHRQPIGSCDRNETTACQDRPILDCSNKGKAIIYFVQDEGPKIELKNNCVIVQGKDYDIVKAADRLILEWYEVFKAP